MDFIAGVAVAMLLNPQSNLSSQCEEKRSENKSRHATPISRPVFMIFRSLNLNPVIDVRPR